MKRTVRINIGGQVFNIDDNAYKMLDDYLKSLENHFSYTTGGREVVYDIELRIAEHFQQKVLKNKQVISLSDVKQIISLIGHPQDFSEADDINEATTMVKSSLGKRLYRDIDNRILGGVCSGIAAYFGIDPWIVRAIFIIVALAGGGGIFVYLILWLIIPPAETMIQKLEMRGEKINLENIERTVKDEFKEMKNSWKNRKF